MTFWTWVLLGFGAWGALGVVSLIWTEREKQIYAKKEAEAAEKRA